MYRSLLHNVSLKATSRIIRRSVSSQAKGASGKRKQKAKEMESSHDRNRRWTSLGNQAEGRDPHKCSSFKVVSYNILAQDLLLEHLFLYVGIPHEFLSWQPLILFKDWWACGEDNFNFGWRITEDSVV